MASCYKEATVFLLFFCCLKFSDLISDREYQKAVVDIEAEYEKVHPLFVKGYMKAIGELRDKDTFYKYIDVYLHQQRDKLLQKLNHKINALERLLATKILVVPSGDFIKNNPNHPSLLNVSLVPKPRMVATFQVDLEAVKEASKEGDKYPFVMICGLPDIEPKVVQYLLKNGLDVNKKTPKRFTALFAAAEAGNLPVVKLLVEHGAAMDLSIPYPTGSNYAGPLPSFMEMFYKNKAREGHEMVLHLTPLLVAVFENHIEVVKYLLEQSKYLGAKDEFWAMLFQPAFTGDIEMMDDLLRHGVDVNSKDELGQTAMHRASFVGRLQMLKVLKKYGGNLKVTDKYGWTPLHLALLFAEGNYKPLIQYLLDQGSDVNAVTDGGFTPLNLVEAGAYKEFLIYLHEHFPLDPKTKHNILPIGEDKGHADIVRLLLDRGAEVNHQDDVLGWSTLHWAAAIGDMGVVKLLVENNRASVNLKSKMGMTPSETADYFGMANITEYLRTAIISS